MKSQLEPINNNLNQGLYPLQCNLSLNNKLMEGSDYKTSKIEISNQKLTSSEINDIVNAEKNLKDNQNDDLERSKRAETDDQNKPTSIIDLLNLPPEWIPVCPQTDEISEDQLAVERKTRDKYLDLWRKKRYNKKANTL